MTRQEVVKNLTQDADGDRCNVPSARTRVHLVVDHRRIASNGDSALRTFHAVVNSRYYFVKTFTFVKDCRFWSG